MIDVEFNDDVLVVHFPKVVMVAESPAIRTTLLAFAEKGFSKMWIDFQKVEMVDSSGIGLLISIQNALKNIDGSLRVINVPEKIYKIMKTMRLYKHFEIVPRS